MEDKVTFTIQVTILTIVQNENRIGQGIKKPNAYFFIKAII